MGKKKSDSKSGLRSDSKSGLRFQKKIQFYSKVKAVVSVRAPLKCILRKKSKVQRRQKKLEAYNLSSLLEALPEVKPSKKTGHENDSKLNCKSRQTLVLRERDRFSAVFKDPNFQADPLSSIQHYLQKTQPVVEEQPKKKENKNGSRKKNKSKALTGLQSMEI